MNTTIIPVIHVLDKEQVFTNIQTCITCGIRKFFLINHNVSIEELLTIAKEVRKEFNNVWIGVNTLGLKSSEVLNLDLEYIDAVWCDDTVSRETFDSMKFKGCVFGGLAFKYQRQPTDLLEACDEAKVSTHVACTSGPATGKPASEIKIQNIKSFLGNHKLAVASGVTHENIKMFQKYVDYILVASSITDSKTELIDIDKLKKLIANSQ